MCMHTAVSQISLTAAALLSLCIQEHNRAVFYFRILAYLCNSVAQLAACLKNKQSQDTSVSRDS